MNNCLLSLAILALFFSDVAAEDTPALFNGKDLTGWSSKRPELWSVEKGEIVGSFSGAPPKTSDFLFSDVSCENFRLRFQVKVIGNRGNSGVQFWSQPYKNGAKGFQADIGPGYWGHLYEEYARGLVRKSLKGDSHIKVDDWNDYEIFAADGRIVITINGQTFLDYTDDGTGLTPGRKQEKGATGGRFGLQLHPGLNGGKGTEVRFRSFDLTLNPKPGLAQAKTVDPSKPADGASVKLDPASYVVRGQAKLGKYRSEQFIGWWREDAKVSIPFSAEPASARQGKVQTDYKLEARIASAAGGGGELELTLSTDKDPGQAGLKKWSVPMPISGGWGDYIDVQLGTIRLEKAGSYFLHCRAGKMNQDFVNLGTVTITATDPQGFNIIAPKPRAATKKSPEGKGTATKKFPEGKGNALDAKARTMSEQLASFSVPEGFVIENVSHEGLGTIKPISLNFDDAGRLWTQTASEYPKDRDPQAFLKPGRDKVLVFEQPHLQEPQRAEIFASGLTMPISVLPHDDGVYMILGPNLYLLQDSDGDGKADKRELLLSGFGVKDSHTCAHHLTRTPGNWINFSQGVHATGTVRSADGKETILHQGLVGRFRPDGTGVEVTAEGFNNIWAWSIDKEGRTYIHEANDLGYSQVAFERDATYPSFLKTASANPLVHPPTAADLGLDGTGFCGIASGGESPRDFPAKWRDKNFIANPITGEINTVSFTVDALGNHSFKREQDLVTCEDPMFRPVNVAFGPDGCLYIVDWYNRTISHGTTIRNLSKHDTTSGRIWRVRHESQKPFTPVNIEKSSDHQLVAHLRSKNLWEMRAAWHQIEKRQAKQLLPDLKNIIADPRSTDSIRIHALWAIEGLKHFDAAVWKQLLSSQNQNVRHEALRALSAIQPALGEIFPLLQALASEKSYYVSNELVRFFRDTPQTLSPEHLEFVGSFRTENAALPGEKVAGWRQQYFALGGAYEKRFLNQLIASIGKEKSTPVPVDEAKWGQNLARSEEKTPEESAKLDERIKRLALRFQSSPNSNVSKGKLHFTARCAACHGSGGFAPPINRGEGTNPVELLTAILKPGDAVEAIFRSYRVIKKDGAALEGFRSDLTDKAITLTFMGGGKHTIPFGEIDKAGYVEGKSVMPESMASGLGDQDLLDLLGYLSAKEAPETKVR